MRGGPRANSGGPRVGSGRPPDPRLDAPAVALLLRSLVPAAVTPSDFARALGTRPERIREALRDGCTERRAGEWRAHVGVDDLGRPLVCPFDGQPCGGDCPIGNPCHAPG